MLLENMTINQLQAEIQKQERRRDSAASTLEKINNSRDYSDEVAKHFHMGMVGFRKDTKRQERTLNKAIENGVKATECYKTRDNAQAIIDNCVKAIAYIDKYAPEGETATYTGRMVDEMRKKAAVAAAPSLSWEKVNGNYGVAYRFGEYEVERVEPGFVAVRKDKELLAHFKTVKEAKAAVSITVSRATA